MTQLIENLIGEQAIMPPINFNPQIGFAIMNGGNPSLNSVTPQPIEGQIGNLILTGATNNSFNVLSPIGANGGPRMQLEATDSAVVSTMTFLASISSDSGTARNYTIFLFKNGSPESLTIQAHTDVNPHGIFFKIPVAYVVNDLFEIYAEETSTGDPIIIEQAQFQIAPF